MLVLVGILQRFLLCTLLMKNLIGSLKKLILINLNILMLIYMDILLHKIIKQYQQYLIPKIVLLNTPIILSDDNNS